MKEQLYKLIEAEGLTPAKFADEIGVQRSSISHILSGRNKPSYDFISKVLKRFSGINAEWLITGNGNMIKSTIQSDIEKSKQISLFESNTTGKPTEKINSGKDSTVREEKQGETNILSNEKKKREIQTDKTKFTNVNNVKYILVFYEDGNFEQFTPRE